MKRNDSGDFSILYVEPDDERTQLFPVIAERKKPVVIMLAGPTLAFQRPDDFSALKRVKRQLDLPVVFVIPSGGQLAQMAARSGFPVYLSMDTLADALSVGQLTRARTGRVTNPLGSGANHGLANNAARVPKRTVPLQREETDPVYGAPAQQKTAPRPDAGTYNRVSGALDQKSTVPLKADGTERLTANGYVYTNGHTHGEMLQKTAPPQINNHDSSGATGMYGHGAVRKARVSSDLARRRTDPLAGPPRLSASARAVPSPRQSVRDSQKQSSRIPPLLVVLTIALIIGVVGAVLVLPHSFQTAAPANNAPGIVGTLAFSNSEHLSENSTQGIADQVTVDMNGIAAPAAGKSYYAWLLVDKQQNDPKALLLGKLQVNQGRAHLFYPGDDQHTSLLVNMSRFLVTEEDAAVQPLAPSPDQSTWRFYGEFSSTPQPAQDGKKFSYLDHLRHLLASDPTLNELELPGGLNNWFYRNISKVFEWTASQRESWEETKDTDFLRRQVMRSLEFLDGVSFVSQDLPPNTPLLVNERLARIGLIQVAGPNQEPPSYMSHIVHHLNGLLQAAGAPTDLRKKVAPLIAVLANIEQWLGNVRTDAQQLLKMSDDELKQKPETLNLINDMIDNANHAYTGEMDPVTNKMREGATWLHRQMQSLASLPISKVTPTTNRSSQPQLPGNMDRALGPDGTKLAKI